MLADIREIKINGITIEDTPAIVPSYSSKGFTDVGKIIELHTSMIAEVGVLISAYDIAKNFITKIPEFSSFIILDSGGYECSKMKDLSDDNKENYTNVDWKYDELIGVLDSWSSQVRTISVSYDHPKQRCSVKEQIERARAQFANRQFGRLLLIKPSSEGSERVDIKEILSCIYELRDFDIIGLTEKELGFSIYNRMTNIAKIRTALAYAGFNTPIHIFGSLDTISTPLYFLSGADIFDGLTWLRYAYNNGMATYINNFVALKEGIRVNDEHVKAIVWAKNYQALLDLQITMRRFVKEKNFSVFGGQIAKFFERSFRELEANFGGGNHGRK